MGGERYWEIDALRGIAIVMMVIFHTAFSLDFFGAASLEPAQGFWRLFALSTATLFIAIAGVSLSVSSARAAAYLDRRGVALKNLKRGAGLLLLGMGITLVTWFLVPGEYILFGVLHCIGLSIALSPLFLRFGRMNIIAGAVVILLAPLVAALTGPLSLAWLGIHPPDFASLDYVPLIPWFGVFLAGMGIGAALYPGGRRGFPAGISGGPLLRPLTLLGKHSLVIYLVHVPIILLALSLLVPGFASSLFSFLAA